MKKNGISASLTFPLSALALSMATLTYAQENPEEKSELETEIEAPHGEIEEVFVTGQRLQSAASNTLKKRIESPVAVDIVSFDQISRIGDSDVASALKRVPGATLVDGKFIFVRGLGERYASTTLNGAVVPSPDLSRNVIPLDIFPTSIVNTLTVQKMYSPDMSAAFGGGNIDIETKSVPQSFVFEIELGAGEQGTNTDFYTYNGGEDDKLGEDDGTRALSGSIESALNRYRGNLSANNIADIDGLNNLDAAKAVNSNLAIALNRDVDIVEEEGSPDISAKMSIGNTFFINDLVSFGFLTGISYNDSWRNEESVSNGLRFLADNTTPADIAFRKESTRNISLTGNISFGVDFGEDHSVQALSLLLRNTDDDVSITDTFDNDSPVTTGVSNRFYNIRYEQREMQVNQIRGEHIFGEDTRDALGLTFLEFLDGLSGDWYFSDSEATTDIPNQLNISGATTIDPFKPYQLTGTNTSVERDSSAADYRFTELDDSVESSGVTLTLPVRLSDVDIQISAGSEYWQKTRTYKQTQFGLGSVNASAPLQGLPSTVFSDSAILNADYGFQVGRTGSNSESYIATNKATSGFANVEIDWHDTWNLNIGARWEDYQQIGLDWDPYDFNGSPLIPDDQESYATVVGQDGRETNAVAQYFEKATFTDDQIYPSVALTYTSEFFAETFKLRFGASETTVRPDLREITDSSYVDPISDFLVIGNSSLVPSEFTNYDVRAEWYFSTGDNLTVSVFHKDVVNPIDQAERAAGDNALALGIINTETATISGLELEFLYGLEPIADFLSPFFIQGNYTFLDTETVVGARADAATNNVRELVGASDAANFILGFDSPDAMHTATLSFNTFGERLFFAGRNGQDDVFEQPFNSLDFAYSLYPTDALTVKLKVKNILDEKFTLKRSDVQIFEEEPGMSYSLSVKYKI